MIDSELSQQESASEVIKEHLSKDGALLETQIQDCVDVIIFNHKQKEDLILYAVKVLSVHNSTLRQIQFFPN